jgi:hypothetical protein
MDPATRNTYPMKRHPERSEGPAFSCTLNNIEAPKKRQPLKNARACFKNGVRPNSRSFVAAKTGPLLRMTPFLKHALVADRQIRPASTR